MTVNLKIEIKSIFKQFKKKHFLVIGDIMLDKYITGNVDRISPEAPVPIVRITDKFWRVGGAANVAKNIISLGAKSTLIGVVGDDISGQELISTLGKSKSINPKVIIDKKRKTTVKCRVLSQDQQLLRYDEEDKINLPDKILEKVKKEIKNIKHAIDGIIIQDYGKGLISENLLCWIKQFSLKKSIPIYIDPKKDLYKSYSESRLFKPNKNEFNHFASQDLDFKSRVIEFAKKNDFQILLVTLGKKGMSLFFDNQFINFPAKVKRVHDVSGAGDTVISVFALFDSVGLSPKTSALFSNIAASLVCEEVGVIPVRQSSLEKKIKELL